MKTVFYAWQSDLPSKTNRSFLEKCLERAIAEINRARNGEERLVLDKDTQGISGMPKVAEVILEKIGSSTIFVADLSTAVRGSTRPSANPNVLVELGYALRALGDRRIIPVLNSAFGSTDDLPFDLKHRRFPVTYELAAQCAPDERGKVRDELVSRLVAALSSAVETLDDDNDDEHLDALPAHAAARSQEASFFESGAGLIARTPCRDEDGRPNEFVYWHPGPCAWLRLIPATNILFGRAALASAMEGAAEAIVPFGQQRLGRLVSNYQGVVVIGAESESPPSIASSFTQVFRTGELWGMSRLPSGSEGRREAEVRWSQTAKVFEAALDNYSRVARRTLQLAPPFHIVAGLGMVRDSLLVRDTGSATRFLDNQVCHSSIMDATQIETSSFLTPFYERVWDACALTYGPHIDVDVC